MAAFARVDQGCGGILLQGNRLKTNNNSGAFARLYGGTVDLYLNANSVRMSGHANTALVLISGTVTAGTVETRGNKTRGVTSLSRTSSGALTGTIDHGGNIGAAM